ncbi:23S rRNA (adenine(2503)-C(2))-methyltransferase RlmN [Ferrovibrio sp.]|uniref:23S rRNA (adenine(2503)-C(2))-methyltransferase RlmN n=1 Tax=Ferrovibrio sp. TaxID=1917215 RepID=UPI001B5B7815|nr:23S rRNA (adenine(2503)-C(2))-methyltransferase RlmN [Ferrovibrio sp.]MBP7062879.1 23S rRNA (adenine(2503)-C(2))-methyltransferase RlmN [Ferrovibrio sp.]
MSAALVPDIQARPAAATAPLAGNAPVELLGLTRAEIAAALVEAGEAEKAAKMRANQLWHWIYYRGARDFSTMTTLAKDLRERLAQRFQVGRPGASRDLKSTDGTRKWLLRFADGEEAEAVHIPEEDRGALCVSSQVGCTLTCRFCHTGTMKLVRNLSPAEIVGQVMLARDCLEEWPSPKDGRMLSNIVMMGMGEPLYNFDNVAKALRIVMDNEGISISKRRITLSTAGVVPMIGRCGAELDVNLAISLHAVRDDIRDVLVPINKKYPIKDLLQACADYPGLSNARRITFEYVMLKGINDSSADARELVRLLKGIPAKVNLIPFNPWPGAPYECSSNNTISQFSEIVFNAGYSSPVRTPRGRDIMAACGQLKSDSVKRSKADILREQQAKEAAAAPMPAVVQAEAG